MKHRTGAVLVSWLGIAGSFSCGPDPFYLPGLALGQLDVLAGSVPIDEALADNNLSGRDAGKLRLVSDVRDYARDVIGLNAGDSYTLYYDNSEGVRLYNVSASRRDQLEPVTWTFPVVGTVPYLGFFSRTQAEQQADTLEAQGMDVFLYEVDAYSTLDYLPNPVQASMLRRDDVTLIDTVIHELLHNTVWRPGDVTFNESLATFVGRTGTVTYLADRFPGDPELVDFARDRNEDTDRYNRFIFDLQGELVGYYGSEASSEQKVAGREAVFQEARDRFARDVQPLMHAPESYAWVADLPTNNAWMLANIRYNLDLELFAQVYHAAGGDWADAMATFQAAADTDDPKAYLRSSFERIGL